MHRGKKLCPEHKGEKVKMSWAPRGGGKGQLKCHEHQGGELKCTEHKGGKVKMSWTQRGKKLKCPEHQGGKS